MLVVSNQYVPMLLVFIQLIQQLLCPKTPTKAPMWQMPIDWFATSNVITLTCATNIQKIANFKGESPTCFTKPTNVFGQLNN
jgi:hypothetical protein